MGIFSICCFLGSFLREISHHRLEQEQVCLLTYSHLTPAPNKWPQGDSGYTYNSGWQQKYHMWMPFRKIRITCLVRSPCPSSASKLFKITGSKALKFIISFFLEHLFWFNFYFYLNRCSTGQPVYAGWTSYFVHADSNERMLFRSETSIRMGAKLQKLFFIGGTDPLLLEGRAIPAHKRSDHNELKMRPQLTKNATTIN